MCTVKKMADILTNVLNEKITINELKKWLTAENPKEKICSDIEQNGSTRTEFISYFLNYLREQCKSVLPEIKEIQEKPAKKTAEIPNPESPKTKIIAANNSKVPSKCTADKEEHIDGKSVLMGQQIFQPRAISMNSSSPQNSSPISKISISKKSPISPINFPPLPIHHDANSPLAKNAMRKISTSIVHQSAGNSVVSSNADTPNFSSDRSPIHRNFPDVSGEGKFAALNHRLMGKMENLDISETDSSNCSFEANASWKFEDSRKNGSFLVNSSLAPCSPISPIYAKNTPILCPRKIDKSQNDHHDSSRNSDNSSATSTPKSGQKTTRTGSDKKTAVSGQSQSVCLGDFMNSDGKGTKKMTRNQMRMQLWKESQEKRRSTSETVSPKGQNLKETGIKINEKKSKRRIKPTRLNVSEDKETRGPEIFGVISRPNTANPKFVGAPSSDKSQEELSFEVERGLMKLERQRQPKSEMPSEISNIEGKSTNIKTKQDATIVPRLDEVTNIRKIKILTLIYGSIMDHNLMINPMTEFYFLITLLTTQYRESSDGKLTKKNVSAEIGEISKILHDDLGCTELADISTETNNEDSAESSNVDETRDDDFCVEKIEKNFEKFLDTAHNCVYFAVTVIFNHRYFLNVLDRATLKLLCENQQIATFRPELKIYLNKLYGVKCTQTNRVKSAESGNSQTNVCFQVDTDNRETFPSSVAFTLFRKQRDLFYDILKDWEDHHLQPDWSFQRALKNKINALLTLHTDAVNYCHFAKLFTSQLLVSSGQSGKTEDPMNDESLSFLKSLKHLNPEKLIQLKGRLVTPLTSTGPVPQPVFPGVQEFYKEFILNASNWKFYVILENTFISEIMELNEAQFAQSEIEATGTTVDESTKQNFLTCVSSLRLLAKFTSFTLTLPFRSAADSPEWLLSQIQLRGRVMPALDLQNCLIDAVKNRRLSLTVPWVVQYMGMLDTVTLRLPYYANISEFLYCIYRKSKNNEKSSQTSILMAFTIGWFFELSNFPREIYQNWQINYDEEKFRIVDFSNGRQRRNPDVATNDHGKSSNEKFVEFNSRLDQLDIIDDRAFYECCPFLSEFKILLISGNATLGSNNANRHITPVSSQLSQPNFRVKTKNLQAQLEEAFFHGQPSSIRKTVDFVSERVASSCVKYICNSIIPSSKQRNMKDFIKSKNGKIDLIQREEDPEDKPQTSPNDSPSKSGKKTQNALMERQMQNLATTIKDDVKRECSKIISEMCEKRTIKSIESLLADDVLPSVKESSISIAIRTAIERVDQWIDSHIIESLFLKNMTAELKKLLKDLDEKNLANKENCHNAKVPSPTEVIEMLRNSMWELLEKNGRWTKLSVDSVDKTLKCLQQTLTERADLIEYPEKNLYTMSVEYSLLLMTHRRDLFTPVIQSKFVKIWKMNNSRTSDKEGLFVRIISSRNIRLLTSTSDPTIMKIFGRLLRGLLKEGLLNMEALSEQCVALFRQEWPETILKQLSQCLRDVVADCKCTGHDAEGMKYLLDWIATTCDQMEICDYD